MIVQGVEIQTYIFDGKERIGAGTRVFQIWLEPDMTKTITQPASYDVRLPSHFVTTALAAPPARDRDRRGRGPVRTEVPA